MGEIGEAGCMIFRVCMTLQCVCILYIPFGKVERKFSCAGTKYDAIVNNALAPWATTVTQDLDQAEFVSLSIKVSSHVHVKLLPVVIRYSWKEKQQRKLHLRSLW